MLQLECGLFLFFYSLFVQEKFPCSTKSKRYYPTPIKKKVELPEIVFLIVLTQAVYRIVSLDESLCIVSVLLPSFVIFV
jgi:hypothetical protein